MLPTASPEAVGMSSERLQHAFAGLQGWLHEGTVTALAAIVARRGKIVGEFYRGKLSPLPDAKNVTPATLFHLASIGKPMTAAAVMLLVEGGALSLDDRLADLLPAFASGERSQTARAGVHEAGAIGPSGERSQSARAEVHEAGAFGPSGERSHPEAGEDRGAITVRHLLSHTSGLPQDPGPETREGLPADADTAARLRGYPRSRLAVPAGSKVEYSNVGYGLLGLLVEAFAGQPFPQFLRERLFVPAGMSDAHLPAPEALYPRIAVVGGTPEPGSPTERYNSEYARRATDPAGNVVGTAADVASFFQLFLDDGRAHGRAVLSPAAARLMTANQTAGLRGGIEGFMTWDECAWGLGFDLRGSKHPHFSGEFTSPQTFGHTGVAGTFAWADPASGLVCVVLGNRLLHNRWNEGRWSRFSSAVAAAVLE